MHCTCLGYGLLLQSMQCVCSPAHLAWSASTASYHTIGLLHYYTACVTVCVSYCYLKLPECQMQNAWHPASAGHPKDRGSSHSAACSACTAFGLASADTYYSPVQSMNLKCTQCVWSDLLINQSHTAAGCATLCNAYSVSLQSIYSII